MSYDLGPFFAAAQKAADCARTRTLWLWGSWENSDALHAALDLPKDPTTPYPWKDWMTGPGGCLCIEDPKMVISFFKNSFKVPLAPGRYAALAFEAGGLTPSRQVHTVYYSCSLVHMGWEKTPKIPGAYLTDLPEVHALLSSFDTAGFYVGTSSHDKLLDMAQRPFS